MTPNVRISVSFGASDAPPPYEEALRTSPLDVVEIARRVTLQRQPSDVSVEMQGVMEVQIANSRTEWCGRGR